MHKLFHIFILTLVFGSSAIAQNNAIQDLQRGARILARQFYNQKEVHKAKTMVKFLTIIDKENADNERLINVIKEEKPLRLYQSIDDNGIMYSSFLMDLLKLLPDNENTREKKIYGYYICSVINPASTAKTMLPRDMDFKNFYADIFETEGNIPQPPMEKLTAAKAVNEISIESLNYNPSELIEAINLINYKLRNTGTQIEIESKKINVEFIDEDNGYKVIEGRVNKVLHDKNIFFKNIKLIEFLKFIEHTTSLAVKLNGYSIQLVDSGKGRDGKPEYFKTPESILKDIQNSLIKSRSTYDNKKIQLKGIVTQTKEADTKFYIELNNIFVVVIDKNRLKPESIKMITEKSTEYLNAKKDGMLQIVKKNKPYLELVVRGTCLINKINKIYINDTYSILAEDAGLFYTK